MAKKGRISTLELKFGFKCKCVFCTSPIMILICPECVQDALNYLEHMKKSIGVEQANKVFKKFTAEISKAKECRDYYVKKMLVFKALKRLYQISS